jgi:hypothetical protein
MEGAYNRNCNYVNSDARQNTSFSKETEKYVDMLFWHFSQGSNYSFY